MMRLNAFVAGACLLAAACSRIDVAGIFEEYLWERPVLLIFAPGHDSDGLREQLSLIDKGHERLNEWKFAVWVLVHERMVMVDGEGKPQLFTRPFYRHFGVAGDAFTVIVLGRDGEEALRTHDVTEVKELLSVAGEPDAAAPR